MPYSLPFSNPAKLDIIVPDMPPGIDSVSTSLNLVGPGYPNYGGVIASNFLHLLENFASPSAPENAIEGQLWYDTSDANNKILKVRNGLDTSSRWVPASGIYRQSTDPINSASLSLKAGDIWIDTTNQQLKIYGIDAWTLIGPTDIGTTGVSVSEVIDAANAASPPTSIIKYVVEGSVMAIIANKTVTPNVVIDGFTTLVPGINLNISSLINGVASSANALTVQGAVFGGSTFLRKDDLTDPGQVITGNIVFQQSVTETGLGKHGLVLKFESGDFIQLYKEKDVNAAILCNSFPGSKLIFKTTGIQDINLTSTVEISKVKINLNTSTEISGTLSVTDTVTLGTTSTNGAVIVPTSTTCDIGSAENPFRQIYASKIGSESSIIYGQLVSGGAFLPGMIMAWGSAVAPAGWKLCNGAVYNSVDYPTLAELFKTTPTAAQFNVPNFNTSSSTTGLTYIIKTDYAI